MVRMDPESVLRGSESLAKQKWFQNSIRITFELNQRWWTRSTSYRARWVLGQESPFSGLSDSRSALGRIIFTPARCNKPLAAKKMPTPAKTPATAAGPKRLRPTFLAAAETSSPSRSLKVSVIGHVFFSRKFPSRIQGKFPPTTPQIIANSSWTSRSLELFFVQLLAETVSVVV